MGLDAIDTAHTAVLAMDCQAGLVSFCAKPPEEFAERAAGVLRAARWAAMPVIHIQVSFRPGLPEVSSRNSFFAELKSSPQRRQLFQGPSGAIHPALGPEPGDIVITKHRVSAFAGTDLVMILRAAEADTLVLFGISTSGVVLSTLLQACDEDYKLIVIADCCADNDPQLHETLLTHLFPRRGSVISTAEFLQALPKAAQP